MANPPKGLPKQDKLPHINAALAAAKPRTAATAAYPLEVRFTAEGESTHLQHITNKFTTYQDAYLARRSIEMIPGIRMACIFDYEGNPVE